VPIACQAEAQWQIYVGAGGHRLSHLLARPPPPLFSLEFPVPQETNPSQFYLFHFLHFALHTNNILSIPDQNYPIICNVGCACHVHLMSMLPAQPCTQRHSVFKLFSKPRIVRLSITSSVCSCIEKHYNIPACRDGLETETSRSRDVSKVSSRSRLEIFVIVSVSSRSRDLRSRISSRSRPLRSRAHALLSSFS
jgi:hypothetical protein